MKKTFLIIMSFFLITASVFAQNKNMYKKDIYDTGGQNLEITFIKHATLMLSHNGTIIHIDPVLMFGTDYRLLPKADVIIITHEHKDHYDSEAIKLLIKEDTAIVTNESVSKLINNKFRNVNVMKNGDTSIIKNIKMEAKPAYNYTEDRIKFHPKGRDNGFVLTLGNKRIYISGDTEDIKEMAALKDIDIAFLSVNQPYTMTIKQCINAANMFKPKILYPYHYNDTDVSLIAKELKNTEVKIRDLQ